MGRIEMNRHEERHAIRKGKENKHQTVTTRVFPIILVGMQYIKLGGRLVMHVLSFLYLGFPLSSFPCFKV